MDGCGYVSMHEFVYGMVVGMCGRVNLHISIQAFVLHGMHMWICVDICVCVCRYLVYVCVGGLMYVGIYVYAMVHI
jgi:hypothetical protein